MERDMREILKMLPKRLVESVENYPRSPYIKGEVYRGCVDQTGGGGPCITCTAQYKDAGCVAHRKETGSKVIGRDLFESQAITHGCDNWWYAVDTETRLLAESNRGVMR